MEDINKIIGNNIKKIRIKNNEYQKETAYEISKMGEHLTTNQLGLYELGIRKVPPNILRAICIHFKISANYILDINQENISSSIIKPIFNGVEKLSNKDKNIIQNLIDSLNDKQTSRI